MPQWLKDAVFYEIYPQSFFDSNGDGIGDLNGVTEKLDAIKGLGCNAIWLNPCFESPFLDAGYDVSDYRKVAARYGTNEDLQRCFEQAHARGMHIVLDLVPGHTSYQHKWFQKSQSAEPNEYSNRYIWTDSVWVRPLEFGCVNGMAERDGNFIVNFFSSQPALNYGFHTKTADWQLPCDAPDCVSTWNAMKDVMRFWLDLGCDGFRVDMADSLVKNDDAEKSGTCALWRDARAMLDAEYPQAVIISEWSCPPQAITNGGFHCDFLLDHAGSGYHSLFRKTDGATGEPQSYFSSSGSGGITEFLDQYLPWYENVKGRGYISLITGNHDTARISRNLNPEECKLAYAFLFTMPGVPFLYYGDEIGMRYLEHLKSKEGGYHRTGSRTPMQWAKGKNLGFSTAESGCLYLPVDSSSQAPTVEEQEKDPQSLLCTVRSLLKLRHSLPDLQADGSFEVLYAKPEKTLFAYRRGSLLLAVNPCGQEQSAPVAVHGSLIFQLGGAPDTPGETLRMAPQSFAVWREGDDCR